MNLFQYITLPITFVLLIWSVVQLVSGRQSRMVAFLGTIIWLAAMIAILRPDLTIRAAGFLGIGRGADLVLYLLAIAYLISVFFIYQRFQRIESNMTEIVRHIALQNAAETRPSDERKLQENLDTHT